MLVKKVCLHCPQILSVRLADMIFPGCCRPQAPRAQPQGQGLQVPPHSHRVPYPPSGPLLQDRRCRKEEKQASIPHGVQKGMCIWKVARVFTSSLQKDEKVNERQGSHFWTLHQQIMCLFAIFISVLSSVKHTRCDDATPHRPL
jgi:hypothetical protein